MKENSAPSYTAVAVGSALYFSSRLPFFGGEGGGGEGD